MAVAPAEHDQTVEIQKVFLAFVVEVHAFIEKALRLVGGRVLVRFLVAPLHLLPQRRKLFRCKCVLLLQSASKKASALFLVGSCFGVC